MVYAFGVGLFIGLPIGCYLREKGYAHKIRQAYDIFNTKRDERKMDQFQSTNKQFYDNLKKGQVNNEDFERYIYGGTFNKRTSDERDRIEDDVRKQL